MTFAAPRRARRTATPRRPVLVILHQEHSTPGRVGRFLTERGWLLDIRRPRFDDPLPGTLDEHAGVVIFGGPMSANDPDPFIKTETDFVGATLEARAPFLGLCLGAQMLAKQLGAEVAPHSQGRAEIGYYPLHATEAGQQAATAAGAPWPKQVYQWHREGFECPRGAQLMATGGDFPVQAIAVNGHAWGLQFHPEVTPAMMHRWTTRAHERLELPGAQPRESHFEGWRLHDAAVALWLGRFLDHWLDSDPRR